MYPTLKKYVSRRVLALLPQHSDSSTKEGIAPSSFWMFFEKWIETVPNSSEDLAYIEKIKGTLVRRLFYKAELLLAYHMLQDGLPLKEILLNEMEHWRHISEDEWIEAATNAMYRVRVRRKR
jgi:hypothetical protein